VRLFEVTTTKKDCGTMGILTKNKGNKNNHSSKKDSFFSINTKTRSTKELEKFRIKVYSPSH